jgi:alkylation response protein AidB-like acyl-CoA dehydrogenase
MIDLLPSQDDEAMVDSVRAFLSAELPVDRFRHPPKNRLPGDFDRWKQFAELGWFLGANPETGLDITAEVLVFRELGRHLASPALVATVIAAHMTQAQGHQQLTNRLMAGELHVALAYRVTGGIHIIDAQTDSMFLIYSDDGLSLYDTGACGSRHNLVPFDPTLLLTGATLDAAAAPICRASLETKALLSRARLLTAALAVGSAEATLTLAADYAKIRNAFGRPIGSFQAVQHRCADMKVRCEESLDQLLFAALCLRENSYAPDFQVAAATSVALNAIEKNAASCIQVHGGMGFTFECEAHYHLKRAHALKWLWGGPHSLRKLLLSTAALYDA